MRHASGSLSMALDPVRGEPRPWTSFSPDAWLPVAAATAVASLLVLWRSRPASGARLGDYLGHPALRLRRTYAALPIAPRFASDRPACAGVRPGNRRGVSDWHHDPVAVLCGSHPDRVTRAPRADSTTPAGRTPSACPMQAQAEEKRWGSSADSSGSPTRDPKSRRSRRECSLGVPSRSPARGP